MHVVFLTWKDVAHPLAGGSEILVDHLATGLHERGHQVTVVSAGPVGDHPYRIIDAGGRYQQYLTDPLLVRREVGEHDVVVDVCNGMPFFSPLWSRKPVVALVNHIHFGMWREWFSPATAWFGATVETRVMPRLYRNRRIVAVSESTARAVESLGVDRSHISVVHNGVDLRDDLERDLSVRSAEPMYVAVGRLVPHKRFDLMLRAWAAVRHELGEGLLHVVGEGPLRAELERRAPEGTIFHGHITDHERDVLLTRSWALVQPSRLEGWGLVVMEAAACGTPTIGFRVPGTRDAVVHEETGILVRSEQELVDRWIDFSRDAEQRRLLAKGAGERADAFSWTRTCEEFEAVLEAAVGEAIGRRPARRRGGPDGARSRYAAARQGLEERLELVRLFRHEKHDPEPFYRALSIRSIRDLPYDLEGARVLDLGSGPGQFTEALRSRGAEVVPVELDALALAATGSAPDGAVQADATRLPFADGTFDGVYCSNMLEHTPAVAPVLADIGRVLRPGGWAWVSWTNWYSPWGGHEIVPFHYLGPELGLRAWRRVFGEPRKNVPFEELWPTHIRDVLAMVDREPTLSRQDVFPRYWPKQRWITSLPGIREVLTWNCVILVERTARPETALPFDTTSPYALMRRGMRRVWRVLGNDPRLLPIVLRATPLGTTRRITPTTDLVVEGFPRSGNTFAHFAAALAEPEAEIISRVHTPSQVLEAVRRRVPTLLVIRDPVDTIASMTVAAPHVPPRSSLEEYIHHHEALLPVVDQLVVATFDEVTSDFDSVLDALNERFDLGFRPFGHSPERTAAVFANIEAHHEETWGDDRSALPVPDNERRDLTCRVRRELESARYDSLVAEARTVYEALAAHSITHRR